MSKTVGKYALNYNGVSMQNFAGVALRNEAQHEHPPIFLAISPLIFLAILAKRKAGILAIPAFLILAISVKTYLVILPFVVIAPFFICNRYDHFVPPFFILFPLIGIILFLHIIQ